MGDGTWGLIQSITRNTNDPNSTISLLNVTTSNNLSLVGHWFAVTATTNGTTFKVIASNCIDGGIIYSAANQNLQFDNNPSPLIEGFASTKVISPVTGWSGLTPRAGGTLTNDDKTTKDGNASDPKSKDLTPKNQTPFNDNLEENNSKNSKTNQ